MIGIRRLVFSWCFLLMAMPAIASTVSGRVVDPSGAPIANARVFLEPGVPNPVRMLESDHDGQFSFDDVPPKFIGLFAHTPGRGFSGKSIQVGSNDVQQGHTIVLGDEARVTIQALGADGKPLSGARVVGVGLQQSRVGIPLQKLRRFGFQTPTTDREGNVVIPRMPSGEEITVKIAHDRHAQEVVRNIVPNSATATIQMAQGVLTSGTVLSLQKQLPVPNAPILFINAEPPNDTSLTRANSAGVYYIRLRPGRYFYESFGADFASVRKSMVNVSGEFETGKLDLVVAATGTVRGKVLDAVTEEGIAGARILLETGGAPNSIATTGESGEYEFTVPEGANVIRYRRAVGYKNPPDTVITVTVGPHEQATVPDFWVAPIPSIQVSAMDRGDAPISGAVMRLLQPEQLGWYSADENGQVNLSVASIPDDGKVIGIVEDPASASGALITVDTAEATSIEVTTQPLGSIAGRVENANGDGLAGWNVHCEHPRADGGALRLWSTTTTPSGSFHYPSVQTGVSLGYWAEPAGSREGEAASPVSYTLPAGERGEIPTLVITGGESGMSLNGTSFPYDSLLPSDSGLGTLIVYASATEFEVFLNTLNTMQPHLQRTGWNPVLVSRAASGQSSDRVRIEVGERPASAQTYLVDEKGTVVHETVGLPEYGLLRELGGTQ